MYAPVLSAKQKIAAACGVGGILFALGICCCGGGTWFAIDYSAKREKERVEAQKKKAFEDAQVNILGKMFGGGKIDDFPPETVYLSAKEPTVFDGVWLEILRRELGKIKLKGGSHTTTAYFQVHYRITNISDAKIIKTIPWNGTESRYAADEFENRYRGWDNRADANDGFTERLDPGKSINGFFAFELPVDKAQEFRIALPGIYMDCPNKTVAYKLPRSFFEKK